MIIACPSCSRKNRVPAARLHEHAKCGECKTSLTASTPIDADGETFDDIIQNARVPVLVDFWAEWCGPCRMAAPHVKQAAHNLAGNGLVLKLNTDHYPEIASRYNIRGIPNFVVFKDGQPVHQQAGLVDAPTMERWVRTA